MAIAVQTDPQDIVDLKNMFMELDKNGDGSITFEELQSGLGKKENAAELLEVLKGADTDNSGTINYTEFLAATMSAQTFMREEYLKAAFRMFDSDDSGKIDAGELNNLLAGEEFKDVYTQEQLQQAIKEVDENGDGEIDFDEFMQMMKGIA